MSHVFQYIPQQHLQSFISNGLYFAPCAHFVDKLEFRFGYAHFEFGAVWNQIDAQLPVIFQKAEVNQLIASTHVSCWTEDSQERFAMWELYGRRKPAVRIKVCKQRLEDRLRSKLLRGACGTVTYDFFVSRVRPQFLTPIGNLSAQEDRLFHMFFHKHGFYDYESEYRLVAFNPPPQVHILDLIEEIVSSPFGALDPCTNELLETHLPHRLTPSVLHAPY